MFNLRLGVCMWVLPCSAIGFWFLPQQGIDVDGFIPINSSFKTNANSGHSMCWSNQLREIEC